MAIFSTNSSRVDPYKNFKFLIKFDGTNAVAAVQKVSGLKRTTEVVSWKEAGNAAMTRKFAGRIDYASVSCEAGVTHDTAFEEWANQVNIYSGGVDTGSEGSTEGSTELQSYRKNIRIELLNEQGNLVIAYNLINAWVSEYQAMPDLDANSKGVAITSIKIEHEGFWRDTDVTEPKET